MRTRTLLSIFVVVLALLFASSCAQTPIIDSSFPDYSGFKKEELAALAESDSESCIEGVSMILAADGTDSGLSPSTLESIAASAATNISELLASSIKTGQWRIAERCFSSLKALASLHVPVFEAASRIAQKAIAQESITTIYLGIADTYLKHDLYSPSMMYFLKALDSIASGEVNPIPRETITAWAERALGAGDAASYGKIEGFLPDEAAKNFRAANPKVFINGNIAEKVSGVVTVYIDKGLKIENGVGYPDRVLGTAFQVDAQGYYLTNYHVVASEVDPNYNGYSKLSIRPSGNPDARIPAKVIGWDEDLDIALLKSTEISPHTFYLSRSGQADKGQRVYAIGSPVGLENSITAGIVSATGRRFLPRGEAIQIDAPVNPGNSGGPLLDADGNLIGVVFAGLSGFQGLNFALPVPWISTIFALLFDGGKIDKPWIGVAAAKNLDSSLDVAYVFPGNGSLRSGDTLLSIDGQIPMDIQGAQMMVSLKPVGSLCVIKIRRNGKEIVVPHAMLPVPSMPFKQAVQRDSPEKILEGGTGMILDHISGPRGPGSLYRVARTWPGMAADESGIAEGDIIKFLRYSVDIRNNVAFFDVSVKSTTTGYLERTMRMNLSLEMANFL